MLLFELPSLQQVDWQVLGLVAVHRTLREPQALRYAPVWGATDQRFIDAVPLRVVAHGAPSGHRELTFSLAL
jgi:hypothetical protein